MAFDNTKFELGKECNETACNLIQLFDSFCCYNYITTFSIFSIFPWRENYAFAGIFLLIFKIAALCNWINFYKYTS